MSVESEPKGKERQGEGRGDISHSVTSLAKNEAQLLFVTEV